MELTYLAALLFLVTLGAVLIWMGVTKSRRDRRLKRSDVPQSQSRRAQDESGRRND